MITIDMLASKLHYRRQQHGLNLQTLSATTGIPAVRLECLEDSADWPTLPELLALRRALDVSLDWLTDPNQALDCTSTLPHERSQK